MSSTKPQEYNFDNVEDYQAAVRDWVDEMESDPDMLAWGAYLDAVSNPPLPIPASDAVARVFENGQWYEFRGDRYSGEPMRKVAIELA